MTRDVGVDLQQTQWGAGRPTCLRGVREEAMGLCWSPLRSGSRARRSTREPPGHAPWTLALGCGSAAPAPTPRPALPSSFMPTAGPPASARSAAPLPAGGGATQSPVAERHPDRSRLGKCRFSSETRGGERPQPGRGLRSGRDLCVTLTAPYVRDGRLCAWGAVPAIAKRHGEWLDEWGRGF